MTKALADYKTEYILVVKNIFHRYIFVGKAGAYLSWALLQDFTLQVGSYTRVEILDSDQCSCLLRYRINYVC